MNCKHATLDGMEDVEQAAYWRERVAAVNARARRVKATGEITLQGWLTTLNQHDGKCALCGSGTYLTVDHIIPLGEGGTNTDDNIQPLCQDCKAHKKPRRGHRVALHQPSNPGSIYIRSDLQQAALQLASKNRLSLRAQINDLVEFALKVAGAYPPAGSPKKINLTDLLYGPAGPQR